MANITVRKNKKGNISYRIRVSNGTKQNGVPNIVSKTWNPPITMTEKQIERELKKIEVQFEEEVKKGIRINEDILFCDYAEEWLENKKSAVAPKTYIEYKSIIKKLIREFNTYKVIHIKSSDVSKYFNRLRQDGSNQNNNRNLSENTIRHYYIVINDILECACHSGIINRNPLKEKAFITPKVKKREVRFLDEEDIRKLFSLLEYEHIKWKTMIYMLIYSGLRIGELVALEWKDINFETGNININKALQHITEYGIIEKIPKTEKSIRNIIVPKKCLNILMEYKEWQNLEKEKLKDSWQKTIFLKDEKGRIIKKVNDKLFTQWDGKAIFPDSISKWVRKFCAKTGMNFTPHSLRHTYVSLLIRKKLPINLISETVGHSNSTTTLTVYSHLFKQDKSIPSIAIEDEIDKILK